MLSILIPIYNYDVRALVRDLHQQASATGVAFEIICMDDASSIDSKSYYESLGELNNLRIIELDKNIGRSAIRNRLAAIARFAYCLFMDCDVMPEDKQFIQNYINVLKSGTVVCGGRSYAPTMNNDNPYYLHWYYGTHREVKSAAERKKRPYHSFMTNNFIVPKSIILAMPFDESIRNYGHEDTVFGLVLEEKRIPILHIDNPLRHIGLDDRNAFIKKTEQAVENLFKLSQSRDFRQSVRLLNFYKKTRNLGLHPLLKIWFRWNRNRLVQNLKSENPNLRNLDLYKLGYMITLQDS